MPLFDPIAAKEQLLKRKAENSGDRSGDNEDK